MKDYKETALTWCAHAVMLVNKESLLLGKYPNGQKLKPKDRLAIQAEIKESIDFLRENGIEVERDGQLSLFD